MSYNLAARPSGERQVIEDEKSRLFEFWQQNLERSKVEAGRIWAEKGKRKGQYAAWSAEQVDGMSPPEFQSMVRRELARLG